MPAGQSPQASGHEQPLYIRPPERLYTSGKSSRGPPRSNPAASRGEAKKPNFYPVNPFRHSPFLKLLTKRAGPSTVRSKQWAQKLIAEVYDARFQALKDPHWRRIRTASFVHDLLSRRYGVKSIVDKMCWELYQTLQRHRLEERELDIFAWFLDELYDGDDLTFFVEARQKVIWATQQDKDELVDMSSVLIKPETVAQLVTAIFGNGAPSLSERVLDRSQAEMGDSATVAGFMDIALEEFRLHFEKPFPKIEDSEAPAKQQQQPPPSSSGGYQVPPSDSQRTADERPSRRERPEPTPAPVQVGASLPAARLVDSTASEWQFPLIVELREQLSLKSQRIYELEEKLLVQGEGRAKVEQQLRQLRNQFNQLSRDSQAEREWVDKFLADANMPATGGDNATKLIQIFNQKNDLIEEYEYKVQELEERIRQMRNQQMNDGNAELMQAQDTAASLKQQVQSLQQDLRHQSAVANEAEAENARLLEQLQSISSAPAPGGAPAAPAPAIQPVASPKKIPNASLAPREVPRSTQHTGKAASPAAAMSGGELGGSGMTPEARNLNMLTQMITQLEESKMVAYEQLKQAHNKESDLEDKLQMSEDARHKAEETVVILEDERTALHQELDRATLQLESLKDEKNNVFQKQLAEKEQQHELKMNEMKQQMSTVMEKVMAEWARVKAASRKSVAVEEWIALEEELDKEKQRCTELQRLVDQGVTGDGNGVGGAAGSNTVAVPDPSVYAVSYTHLRAHETPEHLVCRLLLEKKKKKNEKKEKRQERNIKKKNK
eukprot:TRINITY_DN3318_c0_g1_i4.p1 TRINITY_DN3318_c0_g1~~TRINITY_DN3318_c0_g1_i4.p1  ORF type:complete len:779 (-),score=257.38 TRINITY_DN3318_c0_g1_i4:81-2417(-)